MRNNKGKVANLFTTELFRRAKLGLYIMDKLISSLVVFLIALVPSFNTNISNPPTDEVKQTTIIFTGDIMLGRSVMDASLDNNDSFYAFRSTADFLKDADITFGNLENPIVTGCQRHVGGFKFCTTPEIARGLSFAGFDVVTLANNHTNNYGKDGFEETKKYLNEIGIKSVGYNNLEIIEKNNIKFGFLGFDYVTSQKNIEVDLNLIKESDPKVDVLIISPHWGEEYKATANGFQTNLAKRMVDSGADLIIGHHPHWVQNNEEIDGKPVYYSLGNFIFDQMWSEETKKGLVVKITFEGNSVIKREEYKTYIPKMGQPVLQ